METQDFARLILGIIECGAAKEIRLDQEAREHFGNILSSWLLFSEEQSNSLGTLSSLYPDLTPIERRLLPSIIGGNRTTFQSICESVWDGDITDERIYQALVALRKKLPSGWYYSISRRNSEIVWLKKP